MQLVVDLLIPAYRILRLQHSVILAREVQEPVLDALTVMERLGDLLELQFLRYR